MLFIAARTRLESRSWSLAVSVMEGFRCSVRTLVF
jgi:hypothetical protein